MAGSVQYNAEVDQIVDGIGRLINTVLQKGGCDILMYGKSKAGKTTLTNALMTGNSGGGRCTPGHGTLGMQAMQSGAISQTTYERNIRIYDTQGLLAGEEGEIMAVISNECNLQNMDHVIVCQDWLAPYEERNLEILHHLDPNIWSRVTFVMTKCDIKPPEIQYSAPEEKKRKICEIKTGWRTKITNTLRKLGYGDEIQIAYSTHTLAEQRNNMDWSEFDEEPNYTTVRGVFKCILDGVCSLVEVKKNLRVAIALSDNGHLLFNIEPHEIEEKIKDISYTQLAACIGAGGVGGGITGGAIGAGISALLASTTTTVTTTALSASAISTTAAAVGTTAVGTTGVATTGGIMASSTATTLTAFQTVATTVTVAPVAPIVVGAIIGIVIGAVAGYGIYKFIQWQTAKKTE